MAALRHLSALAIVAVLAGCAGADEEVVDEGSDALVTDPAYAAGKRHSVMTGAVITELQRIAAGGSGNSGAFIKVGDSITASTHFMRCLSTTELGGEHANLEEARVQFDGGSFERASTAAVVGWHTNEPLVGNRAPIDVEIDRMNPSIAIVMLGTNDNYTGSETTYRRNLTRVVDALVDRHIIPILSTIPPSLRSDLHIQAPKMNDVVRSIAAAKKLPLMDYYAAMIALPSRGISSDRVHPNVASKGACDFSAAGLKSGYNVRTLLALEALDRVKNFVFDQAPPEAAE